MAHYFWLKFLIITFLLVSESESCAKRFKEIKKKIRAKFGKAPPQYQGGSQPATLVQETAFPKYATHQMSSMFIELEEDGNGTYRVILEHIPPILSQKRSRNETLNATMNFSNNSTEDLDTRKMGNETNGLNLEYESEEENVSSRYYDDFQADSPDNSTMAETSEAPTTTTKAPAASVAETGGEDEEILTEEDIMVREEWGGECLDSDWSRCNRLKRLLAPYKLKNNPNKVHWMDIDCFVEPVLCLCNGWTVNRCQIMCMSKCNKEMLVLWDKLVILEGVCPLSVITEVKKQSPNPCKWGS